MKMIPVRSKAILAIGYDAGSCRMEIKFISGKTYPFCGVPEHVFNDFLNASSIGSYYNGNIRDRYQC